MRMSFVLVRPAQSVLVCIDLPFFWYWIFGILYSLERNGLLLKYVQAPFLEGGTVQSMSVGVHMSPCCTLSLVVTRPLWSPCYFCWLFSIMLECQRSLIWSKTARKYIVCVVCLSPCACHSCLWGLPKVSRFGSISDFFGSWAFEYCIEYTKFINSWNLFQSFCLRAVQCNLWVLLHLRPSYTLSLVVTRRLWFLCVFFWISGIDVNLQIPFLWGEPVFECIVGVLCCCPSACHSCWWRLFKRWCFGWISHFWGWWAFENHMDYIEITNSWIVSKSFCLRTVRCSFYECWCTSGLVAPCLS